MAKNAIQFQPGMSLANFMARYGDEAQCQQALFQWRWPQGFRCPDCEHAGFVQLKSRALLQCRACHHQTSLISGTLFAATKLPLTRWFLAIYLLTQSKNGISGLDLKRQLGVSYNTAWLVKHKLMQAMKERDDARALVGTVQVDDAYLGGARRGGKRGRGAAAKTPFVAAVECDHNGHPRRLRLTRLAGFRQPELARWAAHHLAPGTQVISDGLACFRAIGTAGHPHQRIIVGSGPQASQHPAFHWVNTMLGNVKNALTGTYHAIRSKHVPRYLAEFSYRFNRRFDLAALIPRLGFAAAHTPPLPYRLAKLAEAHW